MFSTLSYFLNGYKKFLFVAGALAMTIFGFNAQAGLVEMSFDGIENYIKASRILPKKKSNSENKNVLESNKKIFKKLETMPTLGSITLKLFDDIPLKEAFTDALKRFAFSNQEKIAKEITFTPLQFEIRAKFFEDSPLLMTQEDPDIWDCTLKELGITEENIDLTYKRILTIEIDCSSL